MMLRQLSLEERYLRLTGVHRLSCTSRNAKLKDVQATAMLMIARRWRLSAAILKYEKSRLSLKPKMLVM
jgi:hypothetical protein